MRIYLEPLHSPNAIPLLDKATAPLSCSTAWIHQQLPARLRSQGCPCSPTFHISFPRANPPQRRFISTASRTHPSFAHQGRLLLDSKHWAQSWSDEVAIPSETLRCWTQHPFGFAGAPTAVTEEMEVLPLILLSTEETPNEKSDLLLFHVKTESTSGVGEIKKGCISIATVSYDNIEA